MDRTKASQLDFHVTIWSEDKAKLLKLEQRIKAAEKAIAEGTPSQEAWIEALGIIVKEGLGDIVKAELEGLEAGPVYEFEIHSADINWADEDS